MKYIVTGGSGFIGSNLVEELLKNNHEVLNIDIKAPNIGSHLPNWKKRNVLDKKKLIADFADFKPTHIIHLAARTDTLSNELEDYKSNTDGTENVLAAIKKTDSIERVIITSTQFVNQYNGVPKNDLDFHPHTAYGVSKVINEKSTRSVDLECIWTIIRPTNIWGPWHPRYPYEFWRILGKGIYIHPGKKVVKRSYGYVKNVIFQIINICEALPNRVNGKVYYVGDKPIDLLDWVNGFSEKQTGRKVRVVPCLFVKLLAYTGDILSLVNIRFPLTSSRYKSMTTSNEIPMEKTIEEFGMPPYSLEKGIEETVNWLKIYHPELVKKRCEH